MNSCSRNLDLNVVLLQRADQSRVVGLGIVRKERFAVAPETNRFGLVVDDDVLDRAVLDVVQKLRIRDLLNPLRVVAEALKHGQEHDRDNDPENHVLCQVVQSVTSYTIPNMTLLHPILSG